MKSDVDKATNSASVVDLETARCRLLHQNNKAKDRGPSRASRYPEVERLSGALRRRQHTMKD